MAEMKTRETDASVDDYLDAVQPETRRSDCYALYQLMRRATGVDGKMWGPSIVGFGRYHYKYASGREGDYLITGFSSRKQALTLYIMPGYRTYDDLMKGLGTYKTGKSCVYLKRLADVDLAVLEKLIATAFADMQRKYGS